MENTATILPATKNDGNIATVTAVLDDDQLADFTTALTKTLPREIRELIYVQLWDLNMTVSDYKEKPPRFLDRALTSRIFAAEVIESLYSHVHHFVSDRVYIVDYMRSARLHARILPGKVRIQSLNLMLNADDLYSYRLRHSLEVLPSIKVRKGFRLNILLDHRRMFRLDELCMIFEVLKPVVKHFIRDGSVEVVWLWGGQIGCSVVPRLHWSEEKWYECLCKLMIKIPNGQWRYMLAGSLNVEDPWTIPYLPGDISDDSDVEEDGGYREDLPDFRDG